MTDQHDPTTDWALAVVAGDVVAGPHVRAACARHLRDLMEAPKRGFVWDVEAAQRAIDFFPRMLRLNGGQFEGKPFHLHPSQKFRVGSLFGWLESETGLRRFRRFYDEEGKGNGKSPLMAGLGMLMMIADGEAGAEIYAAASKKDQAQVMFRDAVSMREQSPKLKAWTTAQGENPVWQISYRGRQGDKRFFKPISADKGASGPRPHCALCDEVHEHNNRDIIELLERGFKFRRQPLLAMATNSGSDRKSICYEEHVHAVNVAHGMVEDDRTFAFVCSLDDGDDWEKDPSCWPKANPLLGETVTEEYLAGVVDQARKMPGRRNNIARLHFCEWTQSVTAAIKRATWVKCRGDVDPEALTEAGYPCFGGLDLSRVKDFSALSLVWLIDPTKGGEILAAKTWLWTPKDTLRDRESVDQAPYQTWVEQGHIEAVPGERLKYDWLADALGRLNSKYHPEQIGCDQYGLERLVEHTTEKGIVLPAEIHPQGFQKRILEKDKDAPDGEQEVYLWMPDSINKFEEALGDERITIHPNPMLDSMAAGVTYAENRTGHRMFDKEKAHGRIDGMVSMAMAIGMALCRDRAPQKSAWADENFSLEEALSWD